MMSTLPNTSVAILLLFVEWLMQFGIAIPPEIKGE